MYKESGDFILKIESQEWLSEGNVDYDLCSHGQIYLSVNGTVITSSQMNEEWGISESALALLRTLKNDYDSNPECEWGLILHGCGLILMMGCPISIHWSVKHTETTVILSDFVKISTINPETGSIYYSNLKIEIDKKEYKNQVLAFALTVKDFFANNPGRIIDDEYDREMYKEFWNEFNELLKFAHSV